MTDDELRQIANEVRKGVLTGVHAAKSGHPGGSLGAADIMTYLYFEEMNVNPADPRWADRDRFVLSKGHCAPGLYAVLAEKGFFAKEELATLRHIGSILQGHPNMNDTPGVDMSTGSLGQGISAAAGMAKGAKYLGKDINVYTLLGDGEIAEGEVWEAMLFAAHYHLDNFCMIVDLNGLQIDGRTCDVMNTAPVDEKARAFGFHVVEINGHDFDEIEKAFAEFHACTDKPTCILMHTTKGKGVSFMENQASWHGTAPNGEQYETAMSELKAQLASLEG